MKNALNGIAWVAENAAIKSANKELARQFEHDLEDKIKEIEQNGGVDLSKITNNPKFYAAEDEEFTQDGYDEIDRLTKQIAIDELGDYEVAGIDDLNDTNQTVQAEAFDAYATELGLNTTINYSTGGSRYVEVNVGDESFKFRFANHYNTVCDTTMQSDINVSPGGVDFTEAIDFLKEKIDSATSFNFVSLK